MLNPLTMHAISASAALCDSLRKGEARIKTIPEALKGRRALEATGAEVTGRTSLVSHLWN